MSPLSNSDINEPATNGQKVGNLSHFSNICILRVDEFDKNQLNFSFKTETKKKKYSRTSFLAKKTHPQTLFAYERRILFLEWEFVLISIESMWRIAMLKWTKSISYVKCSAASTLNDICIEAWRFHVHVNPLSVRGCFTSQNVLNQQVSSFKAFAFFIKSFRIDWNKLYSGQRHNFCCKICCLKQQFNELNWLNDTTNKI